MAEHFAMDRTTVLSEDNQHNSVSGRDGLQSEEALPTVFVEDGFLHRYHFYQNLPRFHSQRETIPETRAKFARS